LKDMVRVIPSGVDLYYEGEYQPAIKTNDWSCWDENWQDLGGNQFLTSVYFSSDVEFN